MKIYKDLIRISSSKPSSRKNSHSPVTLIYTPNNKYDNKPLRYMNKG